MGSRDSVKAPSTLIVLLTLLLSISPLVASYRIPYIRNRDAGPTPTRAKAASETIGFEYLGHMNMRPGYHSAEDDEAAAAAAAATQPSSTSLADSTVPVPGPGTLNTTSLNKDALPSTCSTLESWYIPHFDLIKENFIRDCYLAVQRLYINDVYFNAQSNMLSEFVAPPGTNGIPVGYRHTTDWGDGTVDTPMMYVANTCTLAILTLSTFTNMTGGTTAELPGSGRQVSTMKNWDVSSFRALHRAGRMVETDCLRRWGRGGWIPVGDNKDIGVFLWATNSTIDRLIRPGVDINTDLESMVRLNNTTVQPVKSESSSSSSSSSSGQEQQSKSDLEGKGGKVDAIEGGGDAASSATKETSPAPPPAGAAVAAVAAAAAAAPAEAPAEAPAPVAAEGEAGVSNDATSSPRRRRRSLSSSLLGLRRFWDK